MKKPNITEGKWGVGETYPSEVRSGNGRSFLVARCENPLETMRGEVEVNAQAISAVPDMIDALMVAKKRMSEELEYLNREFLISSHESRDYSDDIDLCTKALKKAGCEL